MGKQVSLQRSITLSVLSIGLLSGAFGLAYAYWQTKHSFSEAIGLGFQELARQSADKVGLILEKEIGWVERLSSLPQVREAVREGTRLTFDHQVLDRAQHLSNFIDDRHGNFQIPIAPFVES